MSSIENIEIIPVAGRIGAEIRGVKLSADLPEVTQRAIYSAWLRHRVLFFRGQDHLDDAKQEELTRLFGADPVAHPTVPSRTGTSFITELDSQHGGRANSWHTDVTFVDAYPKASILRALIVPAAGGDTVWANTVSAYQDLTPELQTLADKLWALHTNDYDYIKNRETSEDDRKRYHEQFTATGYETVHPVVHVHPDTGERSLILGHFVKKLLDVSPSDSLRLFELLQGHITRLENTVRWRWAAGDVAIWDNRATQHYAINDYGHEHRVMRRVTVNGVAPLSVDGKRSQTQKQVPRATVSRGEAGEVALA